MVHLFRPSNLNYLPYLGRQGPSFEASNLKITYPCLPHFMAYVTYTYLPTGQEEEENEIFALKQNTKGSK